MALSDGNIDAVFRNFGSPGRPVLEVSAKRDIVLVPFRRISSNASIEKNPFLLPFTIKKGTYAKSTAMFSPSPTATISS
jgi:TRAP-type uncharacterized transport system substrate-binding protein